jgi:hypothetical protein
VCRLRTRSRLALTLAALHGAAVQDGRAAPDVYRGTVHAFKTIVRTEARAVPHTAHTATTPGATPLCAARAPVAQQLPAALQLLTRHTTTLPLAHPRRRG